MVFDDVISSALFTIFAGEYLAINLNNPVKGEIPYLLIKKSHQNVKSWEDKCK